MLTLILAMYSMLKALVSMILTADVSVYIDGVQVSLDFAMTNFDWLEFFETLFVYLFAMQDIIKDLFKISFNGYYATLDLSIRQILRSKYHNVGAALVDFKYVTFEHLWGVTVQQFPDVRTGRCKDKLDAIVELKPKQQRHVFKICYEQGKDLYQHELDKP